MSDAELIVYIRINPNNTAYQMQFDAMGRLNGMQDAGTLQSVAGATYGVAGEITSLNYFGASETRRTTRCFK